MCIVYSNISREQKDTRNILENKKTNKQEKQNKTKQKQLFKKMVHFNDKCYLLKIAYLSPKCFISILNAIYCK